ncbi:MAG: hypothetical protein ACJAQ3_004087 [Planctomycetota bacterium]|jgi:hypothetical protein
MLRRTLRSLSLTVALLPLLAGVGCSNRVEKTAEEVKASHVRLMARVQEGKARWAWSGEPAEASRTGAAIESVLLPAWKLKSRYDEWWETEGHETSSDTELFMLPGAAMDPHFESADAKWLFTEPGLEQVRSALLGAVAEEFEGEQEDDLLPISYQALAAKGMVSLLIRRDLERGDHEAAVQGLVALQRFGELWLAREGVVSSLAGFYLLQMQFVGDELGREAREVAWTREDTERVLDLTARALTALEPDLRPLRWEFWHLIQEGVTAKVGEPMEEMIAVADLATEFAGRESAMMETLESLLKRPLAEAVVEALRMADEAEGGIFEYWYWQAVHSYLYGLATARSDLEMLQLALKAR